MKALKQLFRYSILPILAVLIIPNCLERTLPNGMDVLISIIAGTITGSIRYLWNKHQGRKKQVNLN